MAMYIANKTFFQCIKNALNKRKKSNVKNAAKAQINYIHIHKYNIPAFFIIKIRGAKPTTRKRMMEGPFGV